MNPVQQSTFAAEVTEEAGNCLAACIASVLELPLEDVPNFAAIPGDNGEWWDATQSFLSREGYVLYPIPANYGVPEGEAYTLAYGKSPRGDHKHIVVLHGANLAHDPHPDETGLDGEPIQLWLFVALNPRAQVRAL